VKGKKKDQKKLEALLKEYGQARTELYVDIEAPDLAAWLIERGVTFKREIESK